MHPVFVTSGAAQSVPKKAVPILFVTKANVDTVLATLDGRARAFVSAAGFEAKPGKLLLVPDADGQLACVLFGLEAADDPARDLFRPGVLNGALPACIYRFANEPHDARQAALAFALGAYRFTRYRKDNGRNVKLVVPDGVDGEAVSHTAEAVALARDLINTPSNDMGPAELEEAARKLAARHHAEIAVVNGEALERGFPLIHAVGKGSERAPRLIDITWGQEGDPKVTLVGKGVCFDTGGLDIKPSSGMLNMKKDMGGAATALALAHMVMAQRLKVRLRVLIPAVENSISGIAFRPRDVYVSRKGLSVEIGNTDAEGRLVLADALALADEDKPALIADFATLTGAARVAMGTELSPFFTDDDALAGELMTAGTTEFDPLWRMPLWRPYDSMLDSKVADFNNVSSGGFAGAITAALFLRRFVEARSWLHFDIFAWNATAKPARPEGGELMAARALFAVLKARYA